MAACWPYVSSWQGDAQNRVRRDRRLCRAWMPGRREDHVPRATARQKEVLRQSRRSRNHRGKESRIAQQRREAREFRRESVVDESASPNTDGRSPAYGSLAGCALPSLVLTEWLSDSQEERKY